MASVTLAVGQTFPVGTTVGAYPRSNWAAGALPPSGAPAGAATTTAVVASNGALAFTGLADGTAYYASAQVGGVDKYVAFSTDAPGSGGSLDARVTALESGKQDASTAATDAELATHAALTTGAHGGIVASSDGRLTDSRAPSGAAGGDHYGTYPNPGVRQLHLPVMALTKTAAMTIATGGFGTTVDLDSTAENVDPGSVGAFTAVLASDYLRVNIACYALIHASILFVTNATGKRGITLGHQDSTGAGKASYTTQATQSIQGDRATVTAFLLFAVNDRLLITGFQDSGGNLNTAGGGVQNQVLRAAMLSL